MRKKRPSEILFEVNKNITLSSTIEILLYEQISLPRSRYYHSQNKVLDTLWMEFNEA